MPNKIGRNDKGMVELPSTDHLNFFLKRTFFILIYFFSHHTQLNLCHNSSDEKPARIAVGTYCCSSLPSRFFSALRVIRSPSRACLDEVLGWTANLPADTSRSLLWPPLTLRHAEVLFWETWKMQTPEPLRLCCETFHHSPPLLYYSYATHKQTCHGNFQWIPLPHNKIYC